MSSEIAGLESDVREYKQQLDTVVENLQNDSSNSELVALKSELEEAIAVTQAAIVDLQPLLERATPSPSREQATCSSLGEQKWSKDKHPAFQPGYRRPGAPPSLVDESSTSFKVNDVVLAKWLSGDKGFYPARITSITGSSAAPIYSVTFKSYGNTETIRAHDIKSFANESKKRKADEGLTTASSTPTMVKPSVISATASIKPNIAQNARKEPSKVSDGPTRPAKVPRSVKANKELEAGKSKWQDFASKSKFGKAKKESMFRTGESINARVGFTGSGQAMRKDPTRSKHIYQPADDEG